jgi:hypothetical protein
MLYRLVKVTIMRGRPERASSLPGSSGSFGMIQVASKMTSCLRRLGEVEPHSQPHRVFSCVID